MTVAEGTSTVTNTTGNNNIAWRNEYTIPQPAQNGGTVAGEINMADWENQNIPTILTFTAPNGPFVGSGNTITVDIGPVLFARWQQGGEQGTGVAPAGGTAIQILNASRATIAGLTLRPNERIQTTVTFAGTAKPGTMVLVDQTDAGGTDEGGVDFVINPSTQ
jgi:hypothetical protein